MFLYSFQMSGHFTVFAALQLKDGWVDNSCLRLKHTTTSFSLSDRYILSRGWRVIVDQVQTNYHGRPMVLKLVRCGRDVDYEGSSLCLDVF